MVLSYLGRIRAMCNPQQHSWRKSAASTSLYRSPSVQRTKMCSNRHLNLSEYDRTQRSLFCIGKESAKPVACQPSPSPYEAPFKHALLNLYFNSKGAYCKGGYHNSTQQTTAKTLSEAHSPAPALYMYDRGSPATKTCTKRSSAGKSVLDTRLSLF